MILCSQIYIKEEKLLDPENGAEIVLFASIDRIEHFVSEVWLPRTCLGITSHRTLNILMEMLETHVVGNLDRTEVNEEIEI